MALVEELTALPTLRNAWEKVAAKRGAPGIDRVTIDDFRRDLENQLAKLIDELLSSAYRSLPVMRIRPGFLDQSDRPLVIATVRDRVVHRALADLLAPKIDLTLSPACRAFRKGSSAQAAADDVGRWIAADTPWVLRADIRAFFDTIQPSILLEKLAGFVDRDDLRMLERLLRCRVFDRHQVSEMIVGIPQGSPFSPLLANLYLSDLDHRLYESFPNYLRYCDDSLILTASEGEAKRAHEQIQHDLESLQLELHPDKTRICRAEDGFVFLGYHFGPAGRGPAVKAIEALQSRLRDLARMAFDVAELDAVYRGWVNYFGDHPSCWTSSSIGILALLRARSEKLDPAEVRTLMMARWQSFSDDLSSVLAFELARAWQQAGCVEQSWAEFALACGGSRASRSNLEPWARLLGIDSDKLLPLAARLVGSLEERLRLLGESVAEFGQYEVASRLAAIDLEFDRKARENPSDPEDLVIDADLQLLAEWFAGREGVHAVETVNRSRQRSFIPVHRALQKDDWQAHLRGERTLALPLVRAGNSALIGVLDIDLERRVLDQHLGVADELLGRALGAALRLRQELERRDCAALLELSGYKGYHLWIRLAEPVACFRLRRFLLEVVAAVGALPEGVRVEIFPNRDKVKATEIGPVIKLPLGVHSRSGRRCWLLDSRGEPLADPMVALRTLPRVAAEAIAAQESRVASTESAELPAFGPRASKMLESCHVLGDLAARARATSYLNHRERSTLLCTLGHLGGEGKAALHAIIASTYNYRREVTERHIERLPASPMSCPKIREYHPEIATVKPCRCSFKLRGKGYPTPLLFALRPAEIPAFRQRAKSADEQATKSQAASAPRKIQGPTQEAEEKVLKIAELRRHRRGIETSIERLHRELNELFEQCGKDRLELSLGILRRVPRSDHEGWDFVIEV